MKIFNFSIITIAVIVLFILSPVASAATSVTSVGRSIEYPMGIKPYIPPVNIVGSHNELGLDEAVSYVSDLTAYWQLSSLHYYRFTQQGTFGARINYANRFHTTAVQYQLEAYPTLFKGAYADLSIAYANTTQTLFPSYKYRAEGYFTLPHQFEFSVGQGGQRFPRFSNRQFFVYTVSLGKYIKDYFIWVRPFYYTPRSNQFYEIGLRKMYNDNKYLTLRVSAGTLPDIGDLPPLDKLITIKQRGVAFGGQLPLSKCLFSKFDVSYIREIFPNNLERNIITGYVSLFTRF